MNQLLDSTLEKIWYNGNELSSIIYKSIDVNGNVLSNNTVWTSGPTIALRLLADPTHYLTGATIEFWTGKPFKDHPNNLLVDSSVIVDGEFTIPSFNTQLVDSAGLGIWKQPYIHSKSPYHGTNVGQPTPVNTISENNQKNHHVSVAPDNSYVVVWESYGHDIDPAAYAASPFYNYWPDDIEDHAKYGIYAQRFDSNGEKIGVEWCVNVDASLTGGYTTTSAEDRGFGWQVQPAITHLDDGGFVIAWTSDLLNSYTNTTTRKIRFQIYNSEAVALRPNPYNAIDTSEANDDYFQHENPTIASFSDNGFVIAWDTPTAEGHQISFKNFNAAGSQTTGSNTIPVSSAAEPDNQHPQVAVTRSYDTTEGYDVEHMHIVWDVTTLPGDGSTEYAARHRKFDRDGGAISSNITKLNTLRQDAVPGPVRMSSEMLRPQITSTILRPNHDVAVVTWRETEPGPIGNIDYGAKKIYAVAIHSPFSWSGSVITNDAETIDPFEVTSVGLNTMLTSPTLTSGGRRSDSRYDMAGACTVTWIDGVDNNAIVSAVLEPGGTINVTGGSLSWITDFSNGAMSLRGLTDIRDTTGGIPIDGGDNEPTSYVEQRQDIQVIHNNTHGTLSKPEFIYYGTLGDTIPGVTFDWVRITNAAGDAMYNRNPSNAPSDIQADDAVAVLRDIVLLDVIPPESPNWYAADVNNSGAIQADDAVAVLRSIVELDPLDGFILVNSDGARLHSLDESMNGDLTLAVAGDVNNSLAWYQDYKKVID